MDLIPNDPNSSIDTPLFQLVEEDNQSALLPQKSLAPHQQQASDGFGLFMPHQQINNTVFNSQSLYSIPGFTPQHMLQPQSPQNFVNMGSTTAAPSDGPSTPGSSMTSPCPALTTSANHGIVPQIQNIVSTVNLGCVLDLSKIAQHARNCEYRPKRFNPCVMRIREPRTTALIFRTGKMVCIGAKSEEDSRLAARKFGRIIQKIGFPAKFLDFTIHNMVASCDVKFPIRLEGIANKHNRVSSYEPEQFSGLVFRMLKPRMMFLIFISGKVIITGAKTRQEIYDAFDKMFPVLGEFKKL